MLKSRADSEAQGQAVNLSDRGRGLLRASHLSFARMKLSSMGLQASRVDVLVCDVRHRSRCSTAVSENAFNVLRIHQCLPPCHFAHIAGMALQSRTVDASSCN